MTATLIKIEYHERLTLCEDGTARVDNLFALSDRTTVSAFVGMQYLATDKGECDGLSTGSLQNLRGEIGVSAALKATDKAYVYGELSFIGDMVRHNPTATVGDYQHLD